MLTTVARRVLSPVRGIVEGAVRAGRTVALPAARTAGGMAAPVARRAGDIAAPVTRRAGDMAAPVVRRAGALAAPVVGAVARPAARVLSWGRPEETTTEAEPHVARVPTAPGSPSPAAAHAAAVTALAESNVDTQVIDPADLPVENWDGLTAAAVRQRIRTLGQDDLLRLLAYERGHAHRPAVVLALENRLAKLRNG